MKYANNFDFLRVFAASIVIIGHSFSLVGRPQPVVFGMTIASYGVVIFFSISGYLITGSWLGDPAIGRYMMKRCLRIFPALIVLVVITTFVAGPLLSNVPLRTYLDSPFTLRYLQNAALYINYRLDGVFEHNPYPYAVNGSLWSLPAEFAMYLLMPMILSLPFRRLAVASAAIGMATVSVFLMHRGQTIVVYATDLKSATAMGGYFMGGALIKLLQADLPRSVGMAIILFIGCGFSGEFATGREQYAQFIAWAFAVPYIIVAIAESDSAKLPQLGAKGDFSYGLYLYAFPVQQALILCFPKIGLTEEITTAFLLTLPCAIASWHLIEKRALKLKSRNRSVESVTSGRRVDSHVAPHHSGR